MAKHKRPDLDVTGPIPQDVKEVTRKLAGQWVYPEAPPVVSERMEMVSIPLFVEDQMARLNFNTPWLWDAERLENFHGWLERVCVQLTNELFWAYSKAASRGIEQAEKLVINPEHYRKAKERRKKQATTSTVAQIAAAKTRERQSRGEYTVDELLAKQRELDHAATMYAELSRKQHEEGERIAKLVPVVIQP